MPDEIEYKQSAVIKAIKRNITVLNSLVLLILFTLMFLNIRFLFKVLDYVPSLSIVTMLLIVSGLVVISLYLATIISKKTIKELEEYDNKLNALLISMQQEITERKRLLDLIERAKQEWELTVDSLSQVICLLDKQGYVLRANLAVEKWGLGKVKGVKGIGMHELFHPGCIDSSCYMVTLWSRAMEKLTQDRPFEIEENDKVLNRYFLFQALPTKVSGLRKSKTEDSFAVAILHDITKRRETEKQIILANERLRYLMSSTSAVIYSAKASGDYGATFITDNITQITGYEPREFLDKSSFWIDHVHPEDVQRILAELPRIFEKEYYTYEYRFLRKDGTYIWVLDEMKLVRDDNGNPLEIIGLFGDITKRKQAEESLRKVYQEVEFLVNLVENAHEMIFVVQSEGRIIISNSLARSTFGYSQSEILTHSLMSLFKSETDKGWRTFADSVKQGSHWRGNLTAICKDGREFPVGVTVSRPADAYGRTKNENMICFVRDVTEEKEIDRMKTEFISTVSHELRTPLSITREGISLVLDKIPGEINEKQEELLATSMSNIDRLARIINDLLDISKIEAGKLELKRGLINIAGLINQIIFPFESKAKNKGVDLKVLLHKGEVSVYVDEDKIIQVFTNLIENSIKFTEKGYIEISIREKENEVECSVADTGIGILEEDIPRLFSKFQQFARTAGPGDRGTGLGLSIIKNIIEMHGGRIQVESALNKGTTFTFTLPKYTIRNILKEHVQSGIKEAAGKKASFSLLTINMLNFNELEKKTGKDEADKMFKALVGEVQKLLRQTSDVLVENYSNIFILLPGTGKEGVLIIQGRVGQALKNYIETKGIKELKELKINLRSATYPDDAKTYKDLIEKAKKI